MNFTTQQDTGLNAAYLRQQQGTANAGDLQNLQYAQANGWKPTTTPPTTPTTTVAPNYQNSTTVSPSTSQTPDSANSLESSPGVFKASSLADFYNNQLTKLQPQFQAAQDTLLKTTNDLNGLQAPDLSKNYGDLYSSNITPLNSQIADKQSQLATINNSIKSIETDLRQQMGGSAPESIIQAEVAARSKPLLLQQDALTNQLQVLMGQRDQATQNIQNSLGYQKDQFSTNLNLLQNRQTLAKNAIDAYNGLLEKGATATQQERDNFRQLFQQLLYQAPDTLKNLTPDEVSQLQQGNIPASVMGKITSTINQQRYTMLTPYQRGQLANNMMANDPTLQNINQAYAVLDQRYPNGMVPSYLVDGLTGSNQTNGSKIISDLSGRKYDFSNYATDTQWATNSQGGGVQDIINKMPNLQSLGDVQAYINKIAPGSPITAQMISNASQQYGVGWEPLLAIMQHESNLGMAGLGAKTMNPGNVGNTDSGATKNMGSWQNGVNAVAQQIASRQISNQGYNQAPNQQKAIGTTGNPAIDTSMPGYTSTPVVKGMTQSAIDQAALNFLLTGEVKSSGGSFGKAQQLAIQNRASEMDASGNIAANKENLKALSSSLKQQTSYLNNTQRSISNAENGFNQVLQAFQNSGINTSQSSVANSLVNSFTKKFTGGALNAFNAGLSEVANEYTQVFSRGGQVSDAVRGKANDILNGNLSFKDLMAINDELQAQGKIVIQGGQAQVKSIQDQINGIISPSSNTQTTMNPLTQNTSGGSTSNGVGNPNQAKPPVDLSKFNFKLGS